MMEPCGTPEDTGRDEEDIPLHVGHDSEGKSEASLVKEKGDWRRQGYQ